MVGETQRERLNREGSFLKKALVPGVAAKKCNKFNCLGFAGDLKLGAHIFELLEEGIRAIGSVVRGDAAVLQIKVGWLGAWRCKAL